MPRKTSCAARSPLASRAASMRPRPDAAENGEKISVPVPRCVCFNEAAARCRGKPVVEVADGSCGGASMRPRPDAAENIEYVVGAINGYLRLQ